MLKMDEYGWLMFDEMLYFYVEFFEGVNLQFEVLVFNGINLYDLQCGVVSEYDVLYVIFKMVCKGMKESDCSWVIMVVYNVIFDYSFIMIVVECVGFKCNFFYLFVIFDIVVLSGLVLGQMVLLKVCIVVGMLFDGVQVYFVLYDIEQMVQLFCEIVNCWKCLGGWLLLVVILE